MANMPLERAAQEIDPDSRIGWMWADKSPEALLAYVEHFFTIPDERGQVVDFKPNPMQRRMAAEDSGRDLTIKARQTGSSTFKIAKRVRRMTNGTVSGANCLIAFDKDKRTAYFRERIIHHLEDLKRKGFDFKLKKDNEEAIVIEGLNNRFEFASGEQSHIGRGLAWQEAHFSEFAHWKKETASQLASETLPAVPPPPFGNADIESTPAGESGEFYEMAKDAWLNPHGLWRVRFHPWWVEPRYFVATFSELEEGVRADIYKPDEEVAQMVMGFAPDDIERRLMDTSGFAVDLALAIRKILWRRFKKQELDRTPNPFSQEFPEDFDTCWLGQAGRYFDTPDRIDHIQQYRDQRREPVLTLEKLTWRNSEILFFGPNLALWEKPYPGGVYVAWGDAAGGGLTADSDYTCIVVWDAKREKVVARIRLKCPPKHAGAMMCAIGAYFNMALSGWERSAHGEVALQEMKELGYPTDRIYHELPTNWQHSKTVTPTPGIYPTPRARENALETFKDGITYYRIVSEDPIGCTEMTSFTWEKAQKRMKAMASEGQHDDWIMAAAWGYSVLGEARTRLRRMDAEHRPGEPISDDKPLVIGANGRVLSRGEQKTRLGPRKVWFR